MSNGPIQLQAADAATQTSTGAADAAERYLNREIGFLDFNRRVLSEAEDERNPLLERVNFLAIWASNLDEFFMKRVGGLKRQIAAGIEKRSADGMTPRDQLRAIYDVVAADRERALMLFASELRPKLAEEGVTLLDWSELTDEDRTVADEYFDSHLFPVVTPLAVDPGHPFPFISNLSQSLAVVLRAPGSGDRVFARVKIPARFPGWIRLDDGKDDGDYRFVSLTDIIKHNLDDLFPGMDIEEVSAFRVTRNADIEREEEEAEDLIEMIEEHLHERKFAEAIRLETGPSTEPWVLGLLMEELELTDADVYEVPGELDLTSLFAIHSLPLADLKYEPWSPVTPVRLLDETVDVFSAIKEADILVHHPYESFANSVQRFVEAAAEDPNVVAIKTTLYRVGDDSPLINALSRAARQGKEVVCMFEVTARFDERRNIIGAQTLERMGVHVLYGVVGLKTHTKLALVVREESDGLRCYAHIGTGNYHPGNARLYTDMGLFTADPALTADVVELFNFLTGRSRKKDYAKLLVAPLAMRERFVELIEHEIANAEAGRPAAIVAKVNSLEDRQIIDLLYLASQSGVQIDLIVRGFCNLRPGVAGLSENIRVLSVIGRFLEHSRIYYFRNGADDPVDGAFYIGSADWMQRNLNRRVEAIAPVEAEPLRRRCWVVLQAMLDDNRNAWDMSSDGVYSQRRPEDEDDARGTHDVLMELAEEDLR